MIYRNRTAFGGKGEMLRAFVAVDTTPEVKAEVSHLLRQLKERTRFSVKWVKPEQMHITLVFLGEVGAEFIEGAKVELNAVASRCRGFGCRLEGLGAFPSPVRARVLWVGLKSGEQELKELQKEVSRTLTRIGYVGEKRPFRPHLTLGRLREPADVNFISEISFRSSSFFVSRMILFSSTLKPEGPIYSVLEEFQFGNG